MTGKHAAGQQQTDYTDQDRDQLNRALDAIEEIPAVVSKLREPDVEGMAREYLQAHWNRGVLPTLTECFMAGYRAAGETSE
jgi:hypothetical protein